MKRRTTQPPKIGLALSYGVPLGTIYEMRALRALQESLKGVDLTKLDHYVGVSTGGFIAAGLADGMTSRELCASFFENDSKPSKAVDPFWPLSSAYGDRAQHAIMLPGLLVLAAWHFTDGRKSFVHAFERLGPALPTGLFFKCQIDIELLRLFSKSGRAKDFRQIKTQFTLVATHLDNGETAPFGRPGWDHVPISKAIQASLALPGRSPPVEIDDHFYVDGTLKKTMHASVAFDDGVNLMPCLSQTFRSMIHSRLVLGMKQYKTMYPNTDIILIEPDHRDPEMHLANTFSCAQRRHLTEPAHQETRQMLRSQKTNLSTRLARYNISLRHDMLDDPGRQLRALPKPATHLGRSMASLQETMADLAKMVGLAGLQRSPSW